VAFDTTFGERRPEALPPPVDVRTLVEDALADPRNWSAQLPPAGASLLTLRQLKPGPNELLAHPLGTLTVTQRVAPLGVPIERFGTSRLADGSERFVAITLVQVDGEPAATTPIEDQFAPAQFRDLTDTEKLSAPSFSRYESGRRVQSAGVAFDTTTLVPAAVEYETAIIDDPDLPARAAPAAEMDASTLRLRSASGPAALAATRSTGELRFAATGLELELAR
jgi:hypothetical protein